MAILQGIKTCYCIKIISSDPKKVIRLPEGRGGMWYLESMHYLYKYHCRTVLLHKYSLILITSL